MTDRASGRRWEELSDDEIARETLDAAQRRAAMGASPDVPSLIAALAAEGFSELDTLVPIPEGATPPTVMEWCGMALAKISGTQQGRERGIEFERALARIAAPGQVPRSALARMKEAGRAYLKRSELAAAAH